MCNTHVWFPPSFSRDFNFIHIAYVIEVLKLNYDLGFVYSRYLFPAQAQSARGSAEGDKQKCMLNYSIEWNKLKCLDDGEGNFINNIKYYHLNEGRPCTSVFLMKCMASTHSLVSFRSYKIHSRIVWCGWKAHRIWVVRNLVVKNSRNSMYESTTTQVIERCVLYIKSQTNTLKAVEMRQ